MSDAASTIGQSAANGGRTPLNISDIRRSIERYNEAQQVLNEELFGPVQNDSLIIVVQVRHLLLSLCPHQLCSETHPAVPVFSQLTLYILCTPVPCGSLSLATVPTLKMEAIQYP